MSTMTMDTFHVRPVIAATKELPTIFIIDDDPLFCRLLERHGERLGVRVLCFHPDDDFSRFPEDGEFDAGVIDYDLGALRGTQVSALFYETPVLLISHQRQESLAHDLWPSSIRHFLPKSRGAERILNVAMQLSR